MCCSPRGIRIRHDSEHESAFSLTPFACLSIYFINRASLVTQPIKNLPATEETWVPSLGQEDPQEKGMETHSSILAWEIP